MAYAGSFKIQIPRRRRKSAKDDERRRKSLNDRRKASLRYLSPAERRQSKRDKKTTKVERNTAKTASESERRRKRCSGTSKTERINIHSCLSRPTQNEIVAKYTKQLNKIEKIIRNDFKDQLLLLQNAVAQQYQTNPSLTNSTQRACTDAGVNTSMSASI